MNALMCAAGVKTGYRFFRLRYTAFGTNQWNQIMELKFFVDTVEYPTVAMTGNTSPSPLVASASPNSTAPSTIRYIFDKNHLNGHGWDGNSYPPPCWHQLDLGEGNLILPTSYKITNSYPDRSPTAFTLYASNVGNFTGEEVSLDSRSGVSWTGDFQEKTFNIT